MYKLQIRKFAPMTLFNEKQYQASIPWVMLNPISFLLALLLCCRCVDGQESRFRGIGNHTRKISTESNETQAMFDQGLAFLYSFNHDEAIRSFHSAARHDPESAVVHWAIALTNGPHINFPFVDDVHADRLRDLHPSLGHLVHMPSHIDARMGQWQRAIHANEKAIQADAAYRALSPNQNFYRTYMAHNHHMLAFAAMMQGKSQQATAAIQQMLSEIPETWLVKNAVMVDGMYAMPFEVHLRFGRWEKMLAEPEPRDTFPVARCFRHFARGVAFAAKNQIPEARDEQKTFIDSKQLLPPEAMFVMNPADRVLAVASSMLEGEILYREGRVDEAINSLSEAVRLEEELRYIEPPDWIQPVRHVLGATLMDAKRYAQAEKVYRADLIRHPNNGWSLHGLAQCLRRQGNSEEADVVQSQFNAAWQHADIQLTSSCLCLPGIER